MFPSKNNGKLLEAFVIQVDREEIILFSSCGQKLLIVLISHAPVNQVLLASLYVWINCDSESLGFKHRSSCLCVITSSSIWLEVFWPILEGKRTNILTNLLHLKCRNPLNLNKLHKHMKHLFFFYLRSEDGKSNHLIGLLRE